MAENPSRIWTWHVDDTFVIQQAYKFLHLINSVDPAIKFKVEDTRLDGSKPFLDTLITQRTDNSLSTGVHRKPIHTDLYLQWDSYSELALKYSVINTLTHMAKALCSNFQLLNSELQHPVLALLRSKYPKRATDRMYIKQSHKEPINKNTTEPSNRKDCHTVIPNTQGLCESYIIICNKYGTQVHLTFSLLWTISVTFLTSFVTNTSDCCHLIDYCKTHYMAAW